MLLRHERRTNASARCARLSCLRFHSIQGTAHVTRHSRAVLTVLRAAVADEDIAAMPESHREFVGVALAAVLAGPGEVPTFTYLKSTDFFRCDLPKGAEFMNEQLLRKPANGKREDAADMVACLVGEALKALQHEMGTFGMSAPLRPRHMH